MGLGDLDEDQRHAVGIGDVHFVQSPRFLLGLPGDVDATAFEFGLGGVDVADLQPERAGERRGVRGGAPCPASSMSDCPAYNTVPAPYSRATARPMASR